MPEPCLTTAALQPSSSRPSTDNVTADSATAAAGSSTSCNGSAAEKNQEPRDGDGEATHSEVSQTACVATSSASSGPTMTRRPSPGLLRTRSGDAWDELWDEDDESDDDDDYEDAIGEEKREISFAPVATELAVSRGESPSPPTQATPELGRCSTMPILSAGPYPSHRRGSSGGGSLSFSYGTDRPQQQQQQQSIPAPRTITVVTTGDCGAISDNDNGNSAAVAGAAAIPRPRHVRKASAPRLGMLQSAQDLASASEDGADAEGRDAMLQREGEGKHADRPVLPRISVPGAAVPFWDSAHREASLGDEEARGGGGGGWVGVGGVAGGVAGEARRLRAKANSFIGRLPGPKQILHGAQEWGRPHVSYVLQSILVQQHVVSTGKNGPEFGEKVAWVAGMG